MVGVAMGLSGEKPVPSLWRFPVAIVEYPSFGGALAGTRLGGARLFPLGDLAGTGAIVRVARGFEFAMIF